MIVKNNFIVDFLRVLKALERNQKKEKNNKEKLKTIMLQ